MQKLHVCQDQNRPPRTFHWDEKQLEKELSDINAVLVRLEIPSYPKDIQAATGGYPKDLGALCKRALEFCDSLFSCNAADVSVHAIMYDAFELLGNLAQRLAIVGEVFLFFIIYKFSSVCLIFLSNSLCMCVRLRLSLDGVFFLIVPMSKLKKHNWHFFCGGFFFFCLFCFVLWMYSLERDYSIRGLPQKAIRVAENFEKKFKFGWLVGASIICYSRTRGG